MPDYKKLCEILVEYLNAEDSLQRYIDTDTEAPKDVVTRFSKAFASVKRSGVWIPGTFSEEHCETYAEEYDVDEWRVL